MQVVVTAFPDHWQPHQRNLDGSPEGAIRRLSPKAIRGCQVGPSGSGMRQEPPSTTQTA